MIENPITLSSNVTSIVLVVRDGGRLVWQTKSSIAWFFHSAELHITKLFLQSHLSFNYFYLACIITQNDHNISSSIDREMINNSAITWPSAEISGCSKPTYCSSIVLSRLLRTIYMNVSHFSSIYSNVHLHLWVFWQAFSHVTEGKAKVSLIIQLWYIQVSK